MSGSFWTMKLNEKIDTDKYGELSNVAWHALQLMSIPAGEASCERAISKCRWITGSHKTNESDELWSARLLTGIASSRDYGKHFDNPLNTFPE